MGYAMLVTRCYTCHKIMTCNPHKVPSLVVNGEREPICRECIDRANVIRKQKGLSEHPIHPDAYEACDENDL